MTTKTQSRRDQAEAVARAIEAQNLGMTKADRPLVYRKDTEWGQIVFYPNSSKWQHRGKTMSGTVEEFADWMRDKGYV